MRLYLVAGKVTDSVTHGFLPAAAALGLDVVVLTDRPADHRVAAAVKVVGCEVTDHRALVAIIAELGRPDAVFSNSDHLQSATALAADFFDLPAKDWRAALRAKNKSLMRHHLAALDPVSSVDPEQTTPSAFPVVLKPREGVASEDVFLVGDRHELAARIAEIRTRRADPLVAEDHLPGQLHTLETLGDGRTLRILGSFRTTISAPPYFVEERMDWAAPPPEVDQILPQLHALGIGLGACHSEFVLHEGRARLIEVNYRVVGDHADFLLADILGIPLFEDILRIHLGEPLPPLRSMPARRHGTADYVIADRSGILTAAPGPLDLTDGTVQIRYRPHHAPGDQITLTHTNRDFLGITQVVGPDPATTEAALRAFRSAHTWEIE